MDLSFLNYVPRLKNHANIVLFGGSGAGKSSLINSFIALVNDGHQIVADTRIDEHEQMTVNYVKYQLNNHINIWDTWGWKSGVNYTGNDFDSMLNGSLRESVHMDDNIKTTDRIVENSVDAIIFVVDIGIKERESSLKALKQYYDLAVRKEVIVLFAVTKLDVLDLNLKSMNNIMLFRTSIQNKDFKDIYTLVRKSMNDNRVMVLPVINYQPNEFAKLDSLSDSASSLLSYVIQQFKRNEDRLKVKDPNSIKWSLLDIFKNEKIVRFKYSESFFNVNNNNSN